MLKLALRNLVVNVKITFLWLFDVNADIGRYALIERGLISKLLSSGEIDFNEADRL